MEDAPADLEATWYSSWPIGKLVDGIKRTERELLESFAQRIGGRAFYGEDLFLLGVARRALAQSSGFRRAVEDRNSLVAVSLVRLQLDTLLRLYALYWVEDPEVFVQNVLDGEQIDRLKAADGQPMKDKYLRDRLAVKNPWVHDVYQATSGYIHFSDRHIWAALEPGTDDPTRISVAIGPSDRDKPDSYYREIMAAFLHINMMIQVAAQDRLERLVASAHGGGEGVRHRGGDAP